jgi:hypothetical protein
MASVHLGHEAHIEYSILDGRIMEFKWNGEIYYSEDKNISKDGWDELAYSLVIKYGLDRPNRKNAFVYELEEKFA